MTDYVQVAYISKAKGLMGEVIVTPVDDRPLLLPAGLEVWVVPPQTGVVRHSRVLDLRQQAKGWLLTLADVADRTIAERLVGCYLLARAGDVPADSGLAGFAAADPAVAGSAAAVAEPPIGLPVLDASAADGLIGILREVRHGVAQDLWVVDGGVYGEVLIPAVEEFICSQDAAGIRVMLPAGLLELSSGQAVKAKGAG
ncbi:MAG: hypothetical protein LBR39_02515 [Coriobacteriales bacterium]|jgi:16S rRNA processing protein RimM|nr:hypothetical protein [Coriobacteriales bacterium]